MGWPRRLYSIARSGGGAWCGRWGLCCCGAVDCLRPRPQTGLQRFDIHASEYHTRTSFMMIEELSKKGGWWAMKRKGEPEREGGEKGWSRGGSLQKGERNLYFEIACKRTMT